MRPADAAPGGARAALVSAGGRGAIAQIRVWGDGALAAVAAVFRPGGSQPLTGTLPDRPRVGRLGAGLGDEVVVLRDPTRPGEVEIQCHGGLAAVELVLEALAGAGVERSTPEAWASAWSGSPIRGAAWVDLGRAGTVRAAVILLAQAEGALDRALDRLATELEADPVAAAARLEGLLDRGRVGTRLAEGWRVALAGRPNVGKSALLNALGGYERAIVAAEAGTTRDVLTLATAFDGWPVELLDTAGMRGTLDPVEAEGVARARRAHAGADRVLLVLDRAVPLTTEDQRLLAIHPGAVVVANKCDLPAAWAPMDIGAIGVSARHGTGVEELAAHLAGCLVPHAPDPEAGVPFRDRQVATLRAVGDLQRAGDVAAARRLLLGLGDGEAPGSG